MSCGHINQVYHIQNIISDIDNIDVHTQMAFIPLVIIDLNIKLSADPAIYPTLFSELYYVPSL